MKILYISSLLFLSISQSISIGNYPLQVGNRWDYGELIGPEQWSYYYTLRIIGDTVMSNAQTYYIELSNKDGGSHIRYLRQSGSVVYSYASQSETILYDFSRQNGDTISVVYQSNDTIITILQIESLLCFGQVRQTWEYFTKSSVTTMYSISSIADGIGFTGYSGEPGWGYGCMGAIINGLQYGIITSVPTSQSINPVAFTLLQNYPNPFNPSTTMKISMATSSEVSLSIFNLLGQEVSVLYRGQLKAGNHTFPWNAGNLSGGMYFCRMKAGEFSKSLKLILLK